MCRQISSVSVSITNYRFLVNSKSRLFFSGEGDLSSFERSLNPLDSKAAQTRLLDDGWKIVEEKSKGNNTVYKKTIEGESYYLRWNESGRRHSLKEGETVSYWKLGKGKKADKALLDRNVLFRISKDENFTKLKNEYMSYTAIVDLLICARDYSNLSENEIAENLEFLDENMDELIEFRKLVPNQNLEITRLYDSLNDFFVSGHLVTKRITSNDENWILIKNNALEILNSLKIEIISPNDFLDKYDWEDGEQWDNKKGCR